MRRTLLTSAALLAIMTAPSLAQGTGTGPQVRDPGGEAGGRAAQERGRTESPSREGRAERPTSAASDQRSGAEQAETRRETRDGTGAGQTQQSTPRTDGQERRAAEQRDEPRGAPRPEIQRAEGQRDPGQRDQGRQGAAAGQADQQGRSGESQQERDRRNAAGPSGNPPDASRSEAGRSAGQGDGSATRSATSPQPAARPADRSGTAQGDAGRPGTGAPGSAPPSGTASRDVRSTETRTETRAEITPERRERITEIISRESRERPRIDFSVTVGTVVPNHVRRRPLPTEIVEIEPRYRGYDYFVAEDEIVVVEPQSRRIVTKVSRTGQITGSGEGGGAAATAAALATGTRAADETASTSAGALCRIEDLGRGGAGGSSGLAVAVRNPDGRSTDMISLPSGRIIVAVDPSGGCTITVER